MKNCMASFSLTATLIICLLLVASPSAWADKQKIDRNKWLINDHILIETPDGAHLSVLVVRPNIQQPLPVALRATIYAEQERNKDIQHALFAAQRGYVGVVGYSRGKHLSRSAPSPYKHEALDVNVIIDWLSKQPWSDGRVAMYGGSYEGFTQWSAAKNLHPSVKTMVPYVAAMPGYGLPMENNIFLNANLGWSFHVTNTRYTDHSIYQQRQRWSDLNQSWFESGKSYRQLDSFDKRANYLLHEWLDHPGFDEYWQRMVPTKHEYAKIDIPILSITGYYDDGQISAMRYLSQHEKYHANPNHYLIIGPYDHWTAQRRPTDKLRDIQLDTVAEIDVPEITFQWFDYVLKGKPKPPLIKDKINFQLMGANKWQSAPSLHALNARAHPLYFNVDGGLGTQPGKSDGFIRQSVDFTDRETQNSYYPWPIMSAELPSQSGVVYVSEPITQDMIYAGQFSANLDIRINLRDVDLNLVVYQLTKAGQYFHLSYYLGRASYAKDMAKRQLLVPGDITTVPVTGTRMNGKLLEKGSRLVVVANVNKNNFAQVNYGSGKDVSEENIKDAKGRLQIDWMSSSTIQLPLTPVLP